MNEAPALPPHPLHGALCPECGHMFDSHSPVPCGCPVIDITGWVFADKKALFAGDGTFNLTLTAVEGDER